MLVVRTKIRDKERERIFESGVLDSEATGRLAVSKTSRLRRTALVKQHPRMHLNKFVLSFLQEDLLNQCTGRLLII